MARDKTLASRSATPAHSLLIGGRLADGADVFPVRNPANNEITAWAPSCTSDQLDDAVAAARHAQPSWAEDEGKRREALRASARTLEGAIADMAALLTSEMGKPISEAQAEIAKTVTRFDYFADLEIPREVRTDAVTGRTLTLLRVPVGVVAVIVPWNYPVNIGVNRMAPALLAGNTIIAKPSEVAPLTTLALGELIAPHFPPGVINVLTGGGWLGQALSTHPGVDLVSFTGSTETGRKVAEAAGPSLKRTILELGGNDAAVVIEPFDVEATARGLVASGFANCGQVCYSVKRVYVPRDRRDALVEKMIEEVERLRVGDGADLATTLGPLATAGQLDRLLEIVDRSVAQGARVVTGGEKLDAPGNFYAPTLLVDCSDNMPIVTEEQFGPVLPIIAYDDLDEAVRLANSSQYGLAGSIWSSDLPLAEQVAPRLNTSTIWINSHGTMAPSQPHSGLGWSGTGTVGGGWQGLMDVTSLKVLSTTSPVA